MLQKLLREEDGQDIAEYAVMLAVILVLVIGTIRLIGSNANNAFSAVANSMQQPGLIGPGSRHCYGIIAFIDRVVSISRPNLETALDTGSALFATSCT